MEQLKELEARLFEVWVKPAHKITYQSAQYRIPIV
jgi:hypothetical protein